MGLDMKSDRIVDFRLRFVTHLIANLTCSTGSMCLSTEANISHVWKSVLQSLVRARVLRPARAKTKRNELPRVPAENSYGCGWRRLVLRSLVCAQNTLAAKA